MVAEEQYTSSLTASTLSRLDPLAPTGALVDGLEETERATLGVRAVVLAHNWLDSLRSLVGVVEGDGGDVVVKDVGLDDAVEHGASNEAELAVNGGGGTTDICPGLRVVVRKSRVGVLEEGDGDEPVVDPQVGDDVPNKEVGEAVVLANPGKSSEGDGNADVGQENELLILLLVEGRRGVEVVDTLEETVLLADALALRLAAVVVVTSDVADQVHRPATQLLRDHVDQGSNGSLLGKLVKLVNELADARSINLPGLGNENHVALHVAGGLVVLAVGDLPGEVGHKESRVANPANGVVENLGGGEGLVAALVSHDPKTSARQALNEGVECPQDSADRHRGDCLGCDIVVEDVEDGRELDDVASDVTQTADSGALKAVLGDSRAKLANGVVGDLELVAVGVDELAGRLSGSLSLRAKRRERGIGGRSGRGVGGRVRNGRRSRVGGDIAPQCARRAGGCSSSHLENKRSRCW